MIASSQATNVKSTYRVPRKATAHIHKTTHYPTRLNSIASESGSTGTNDENRLLKCSTLNSNEIVHVNASHQNVTANETEEKAVCFLSSVKNKIIDTIKNISNKKDEG
jgi:hypothetical protein